MEHQLQDHILKAVRRRVYRPSAGHIIMGIYTLYRRALYPFHCIYITYSQHITELFTSAQGPRRDAGRVDRCLHRYRKTIYDFSAKDINMHSLQEQDLTQENVHTTSPSGFHHHPHEASSWKTYSENCACPAANRIDGYASEADCNKPQFADNRIHELVHRPP